MNKIWKPTSASALLSKEMFVSGTQVNYFLNTD